MRYSIKTLFVSMKYIQGEHYYWNIFQLSLGALLKETLKVLQRTTSVFMILREIRIQMALIPFYHSIVFLMRRRMRNDHSTNRRIHKWLWRSQCACVLHSSLSQYFIRNNTMSRSSPSSRSIMDILEVLRSTFVVSSSVLEVVSVVIGESLGRIPW